MALIHVVYGSEATVEFSDQQIRALLEKARQTNKAADISGILLLIDRSFFQILEGDAEAVGQP